MEIYDGQEEMVAGTAYHRANRNGRAGNTGRQFRHGAFYLYTVLMKKPQRHKELETILVLVLALGLLYWRYKKPYFLGAALILGLVGLLLPAAGRLIHQAWMKLAEGMGFIMNRLLLTIIYLLVVTPLGWMARKTGRSAIRLKPGDKSYFKERNHVYTRHDIENPW